MFCGKVRATTTQEPSSQPNVKNILSNEMVTVLVSDYSGIMHVDLENADLAMINFSKVNIGRPVLNMLL